jgi:hypothetical protein
VEQVAQSNGHDKWRWARPQPTTGKARAEPPNPVTSSFSKILRNSANCLSPFTLSVSRQQMRSDFGTEQQVRSEFGPEHLVLQNSQEFGKLPFTTPKSIQR